MRLKDQGASGAGTTDSIEFYRAQVLSNDGRRWVDGGRYRQERFAQADAADMHRLYGNLVRVVTEA